MVGGIFFRHALREIALATVAVAVVLLVLLLTNQLAFVLGRAADGASEGLVGRLDNAVTTPAGAAPLNPPPVRAPRELLAAGLFTYTTQVAAELVEDLDEDRDEEHQHSRHHERRERQHDGGVRARGTRGTMCPPLLVCARARTV